MKTNVWNILKKELKELFRDKKSLAMMLIIPLFIPFIVIGMSALFESQMTKEPVEYNKIGFAYELSDEERTIAENMDLEIFEGNASELKQKRDSGEIYLYITKNGDTYTINSTDNDSSSYARNLMNSYFETYKKILQQNYLEENEIEPEKVLNIITVDENIEKKGNYFASYIQNYAFLFIIMAITVSATYPSTDSTAGEKERGTLETLLTFPIRSKDIIVGKFLGVSASSIITGFLSLILAIISLLVANSMFTIFEGINIVYNVPSIIVAILIIVAFSFFISGLCIAIASKSKSFKEAQSALTPLNFITFFPGMIVFMIGIKSSTILSLVPFLNYTMIFIDVVNGSIKYLDIILMLLSTILYISIVLIYIIKEYKSEKVLF
ncbi:MAG: ABC transporter permease [Bacilli bacterium]|nr:ABC transporter permease [Bacilli bacterium]